MLVRWFNSLSQKKKKKLGLMLFYPKKKLGNEHGKTQKQLPRLPKLLRSLGPPRDDGGSASALLRRQTRSRTLQDPRKRPQEEKTPHKQGTPGVGGGKNFNQGWLHPKKQDLQAHCLFFGSLGTYNQVKVLYIKKPLKKHPL